MVAILKSLGLSYHKIHSQPTKASQPIENNNFDANRWILLPMKSSAPTTNATDLKQKQFADASESDLASSSLGDKLVKALEQTRALIKMLKSSNSKIGSNEAVLFLGMDSPELPMEEIVCGLLQSNDQPTNSEPADNCISVESKAYCGKAHMCPANDGGYGLLSVPKHAPAKIFSSVRWSNSLTAVSQVKALTDCNVQVTLGKLMYDVDEPEDVKSLISRLASSRNDINKNICSGRKSQTDDSLSNFSSGVGTFVATSISETYPHHTWKALTDLNLVQNLRNTPISNKS